MLTRSRKRSLESAAQLAVAEAIAGNEDLLSEILLRLPVKSLLRFESVSKKWLSLISDPHFAQSYTRRHNPNLEPSGLLLNHDDGGFQFVPFNDGGDSNGEPSRVKLSSRDDPGIIILHSCNGLLLCFSAHLKGNSPVFDYYICNPTTKQFSALPFHSHRSEDTVISIHLAFDPLKSPHYKLICVRVVHELSFTFGIDIYSSETRSLRTPTAGSGCPLTFTPPRRTIFNCAVYFNGAIHWYSAAKTSLYFDADTEQLKTMPMPPFPEDFHLKNNGYFMGSRGHLHLVMMEETPTMKFDILELKTDYSGWFVRYRVNLDPVAVTFPEIILKPTLLCLVRAEKEEDSTLVLVVSRKAISFNLNDKTSKNLGHTVPCHQFAPLGYHFACWEAYEHSETLFHV